MDHLDELENQSIFILREAYKNFKNLARWYDEIAKRPAVKKGYDFLNRGEVIPKV